MVKWYKRRFSIASKERPVKNMSESREEMLHSTAKAREQVMIDRLLESFYKHKDEILKATQEKKD